MSTSGNHNIQSGEIVVEQCAQSHVVPPDRVDILDVNDLGRSGPGRPGRQGDQGPSGVSGQSGWSGISGDSGRSGWSGMRGPFGLSGASGTSGISGFSGPSGISGFSSLSGFSGYSSQSGVSGISGWSGASGSVGPQGLSGAHGISGISGKSGYSASSGWSGTSGFSGLSGAKGLSGRSGTSGFSGQMGASGTSGFSGAFSGHSGFSGSSGVSGFSGTWSGASGFSGVQGTGIVEQQLFLISESFLVGLSGFSSRASEKVGRMSVVPFGPDWPEAVDFSTELPEGFEVGHDVDVNVVWHPSTDDLGDILLRLEWEVVDVGQDSTPPGPTGYQEILVPALGIAELKQELNFTVPADDVASETESIRFTLIRMADDGADTYVGFFSLESVVVRYLAGGGAGISGFSGFSGHSGCSGESGAVGFSGTSGFSGTYSGKSGFSGFSGSPAGLGHSGVSGTSGYSGYSGYSGGSGRSGSSGYSGAGGAVGGSDSQVQYNNGGIFGGTSKVTYDDVNNRLGIDNTSPDEVLQIGKGTYYRGYAITTKYEVTTTGTTPAALVTWSLPTNLTVYNVLITVVGTESWDSGTGYDGGSSSYGSTMRVVTIKEFGGLSIVGSQTTLHSQFVNASTAWSIVVSIISNNLVVTVTGGLSERVFWGATLQLNGIRSQ